MEEKRLMKILDVESEQRFVFRRRIYFLDEDGRIHAPFGGDVSARELCDMISNPEQICPLLRLTVEEKAVCEALGARWISRDNEELKVALWKTEPLIYDMGAGYCAALNDNLLAYIFGSTFSLRPEQKKQLNLVQIDDGGDAWYERMPMVTLDGEGGAK